jgi:flagellar motor switch protein FliN/FliY
MSILTPAANRQQLLNRFVEQLAATLQRGCSVKLSVSRTPSSRRPAGKTEYLWWRCADSTNTTGATVWIGVAKDAWESVAYRIGESSDPEAAYSSVLDTSWGLAGTLTNQPLPYEPEESVRISLSETEAVDLLLAFENAVPVQGQPGNGADQPALGVLLDIELPVTLRFGRTKMTLDDILRLNTGSVVEFDRHVDEPIEVLVNGRVAALGEAVMVQGNYAVRISEIAGRRDRTDAGRSFTGA